jgi:SAM-dependent methyltransferase
MANQYRLYALELIDDFPAGPRAGAFLMQMILERGCRSVAEIGGGANPLLDEEFVRAHGLQYCLIDKSAAELEKAGRHDSIVIDAMSNENMFNKALGGRRFDLVFSHMFLEHIEDPLTAHRNFYRMLNPGGRCVHFYPSPNNLPLLLNRLLPEAVSLRLVGFAKPARQLDGAERKFKAYYHLCGAPGPRLAARFEEIGYTVCRFSGFIGHGYYERCKPLAWLELKLRRIIHRLRLPLTSGCLLVLEKPS